MSIFHYSVLYIIAQCTRATVRNKRPGSFFPACHTVVMDTGKKPINIYKNKRIAGHIKYNGL